MSTVNECVYDLCNSTHIQLTPWSSVEQVIQGVQKKIMEGHMFLQGSKHSPTSSSSPSKCILLHESSTH